MLNPLNILSKFIKSGNQRELDKLQNIVNEVNKLEENISKLDDNEFPEKTQNLKNKLQNVLGQANLFFYSIALIFSYQLRVYTSFLD